MQNMVCEILHWLEDQKLECLYKGIRFECAMGLRVAPNNVAFKAAWDRIRFALDGNNRPVAYLP